MKDWLVGTLRQLERKFMPKARQRRLRREGKFDGFVGKR